MDRRDFIATCAATGAAAIASQLPAAAYVPPTKFSQDWERLGDLTQKEWMQCCVRSKDGRVTRPYAASLQPASFDPDHLILSFNFAPVGPDSPFLDFFDEQDTPVMRFNTPEFAGDFFFSFAIKRKQPASLDPAILSEMSDEELMQCHLRTNDGRRIPVRALTRERFGKSLGLAEFEFQFPEGPPVDAVFFCDAPGRVFAHVRYGTEFKRAGDTEVFYFDYDHNLLQQA